MEEEYYMCQHNNLLNIEVRSRTKIDDVDVGDDDMTWIH